MLLCNASLSDSLAVRTVDPRRLFGEALERSHHLALTHVVLHGSILRLVVALVLGRGLMVGWRFLRNVLGSVVWLNCLWDVGRLGIHHWLLDLLRWDSCWSSDGLVVVLGEVGHLEGV